MCYENHDGLHKKYLLVHEVVFSPFDLSCTYVGVILKVHVLFSVSPTELKRAKFQKRGSQRARKWAKLHASRNNRC